MHQVQHVDVGIGISDGSKQMSNNIERRLFESPDHKFPLDATASPDVGDQQGPSLTTTSQDVREESSIECESCYPRAVHVVSKGSFFHHILRG